MHGDLSVMLLLNFVPAPVSLTNKIRSAAYFLRLPEDYYHYQRLALEFKGNIV